MSLSIIRIDCVGVASSDCLPVLSRGLAELAMALLMILAAAGLMPPRIRFASRSLGIFHDTVDCEAVHYERLWSNNAGIWNPEICSSPRARLLGAGAEFDL